MKLFTGLSILVFLAILIDFILALAGVSDLPMLITLIGSGQSTKLLVSGVICAVLMGLGYTT